MVIPTGGNQGLVGYAKHLMTLGQTVQHLPHGGADPPTGDSKEILENLKPHCKEGPEALCWEASNRIDSMATLHASRFTLHASRFTLHASLRASALLP